MTQEIYQNTIPAMTDSLGKFLEQPSPSEILTDETHAVMTDEAFRKLKNYSHTTPSGVYVGKMWRLERRGVWYLAWYSECAEPGFMSNNYRQILIA